MGSTVELSLSAEPRRHRSCLLPCLFLHHFFPHFSSLLS